MSSKRVLTVQDISCVGQCSLTAALPILAACGVEAIPLPTALLSTHTGGFHGNTFLDLTAQMPAIAAHWQKEKLTFDCLYSGYLGSTQQLLLVEEMRDRVIRKDGLLIVDPVMADHGKLYRGFDNGFVGHMARFCAKADIILPNLTEAAFMTESELLPELQDTQSIHGQLRKLAALGPRTVILKGIQFRPDEIGVAVYDCAEDCETYYFTEKIGKSFYGTGDCFAAAFTGAVMQGRDPVSAAKLAADFVAECIRRTVGDAEHWYGVKVEKALPMLMAACHR